MKQTLCWKCARACGKCPWSDGSFTPVDGWTATPTKIKEWYEIVDSYLVEKCPLFISDVWVQVNTKTLAKIFNIGMKTFFRWTDEHKILKAKKCGYELKIDKSNPIKKILLIRKVE